MNTKNMTSEEIFKKYLEDKCPVCDSKKDREDFHGHTESGGKYMAMYFNCAICNTEYTVGMNRKRMPIQSEITQLGVTPN